MECKLKERPGKKETTSIHRLKKFYGEEMIRAAFIAAPRAATAGADLGGRAFLHSYDWQADEGFATLELIMTAPVVVASWISLQYYGSTVAPTLFGGGNKLLHNVVGGIGVFVIFMLTIAQIGPGAILIPVVIWLVVINRKAQAL